MPFATTRKEVPARRLERLCAIGPDLVDAGREQAQERCVQPLEPARAVFRDVLEGHAREARHQQCGEATHDVRLLQRQHHRLRPEGEPRAEDARESGRARPQRQPVAVGDESNPRPEPRRDRVCEVAPATAEGEHPQVVALERPVLDERQEPVFGAPMIEPVHHVEDAHRMPLRRKTSTAAGHATAA